MDQYQNLQNHDNQEYQESSPNVLQRGCPRPNLCVSLFSQNKKVNVFLFFFIRVVVRNVSLAWISLTKMFLKSSCKMHDIGEIHIWIGGQ